MKTMVGFGFGLVLASAVGICVAKRSYKKYDVARISQHDSVMPLVIIGSGPAGLNAAVYGARLGVDTLVIRGDQPGGMIAETGWVENWPGSKRIQGPTIIDNLTEQAQVCGAHFLDDTVERVDFSSWPFKITTEDGRTITALSVIIATGSKPRMLRVPGEDAYWGAGVSACAVCDAPFYDGKEAIVVGGGDSAIEEAIQLIQYARKVTILVRRDAMRASAAMQDRLADYPAISVRYNTQIEEIVGDESGVTAVRVATTADESRDEIAADGVFLAIGHEPNTELFKGVVALDETTRHIQLTTRTKQTSVEGVFAAGDVEDDRYRQACVAAGSGAQAALDAQKFLASIGITRKLAANIRTFWVDDANPQAAPDGGLPCVTSLAALEQKLAETGELVCLYAVDSSAPSYSDDIASVKRALADATLSCVLVDIHAAVDAAQRYCIEQTPCCLMFQGGALVARNHQVENSDALLAFVRNVTQHGAPTATT